MKPGGYAVFEFPYLFDLLKHCEFDTIYHEHVFYFSLAAVQILATRAGLRLVDAEHQSVHGGTLRVYLTGAAEAPRPTLRLEAMLEHERSAGLTNPERYQDFSRQVADIRTSLCSLLQSLRAKGKTIAAYGAPAKGNTLLELLRHRHGTDRFTVDRSPHKQNRLLPGSHIPVSIRRSSCAASPTIRSSCPGTSVPRSSKTRPSTSPMGAAFILPIPKPVVLSGSRSRHWFSRLRRYTLNTLTLRTLNIQMSSTNKVLITGNLGYIGRVMSPWYAAPAIT